MSTFAGVIFDLDGVITDTAELHYQAWKNLASRYGWRFSREDNHRLKGVSRDASLQLILDMNAASVSSTQFQQLLAEKNQDYLQALQHLDASAIFPGVIELLADLKAYGIAIALGSASKNARQILTQLGLLDQFAVLGDGNITSKAKPDPSLFAWCAEQLQLDPHQCVVIEDSVAGLQAASALHMKTVAVQVSASDFQADLAVSSMQALSYAHLKVLFD